MGIVEPFDVLKEREPGGIARREAVACEQLAFEGGEETLRHRVVEAVAPAARRRDQTGVAQTLAEGEARVLAPLVRVVNHSRARRSPLPQCHLDRFDHQLST